MTITPIKPIQQFTDLLGHTLSACEQRGDSAILFTLADGRRFSLHHEQDCCEIVYIESVTGDLEDLVGEPLTLVDESKSETDVKGEGREDDELYGASWTFYKLATRKGFVDVRFYGESNGYYSESAELVEVTEGTV